MKKQSTKNGQPNQNCIVCKQLSPTQVKELETEFLHMIRMGQKGQMKKTLSKKYAINLNDIISHMDQRQRHREAN